MWSNFIYFLMRRRLELISIMNMVLMIWEYEYFARFSNDVFRCILMKLHRIIRVYSTINFIDIFGSINFTKYSLDLCVCVSVESLFKQLVRKTGLQIIRTLHNDNNFVQLLRNLKFMEFLNTNRQSGNVEKNR